MDLSTITKQLHREVHHALSTADPLHAARPHTVATHPWQARALQSQQVVLYVYDKLYDIIRRNHIAFANKLEEEGFLSALEPAINDIIIRHIPD